MVLGLVAAGAATGVVWAGFEDRSGSAWLYVLALGAGAAAGGLAAAVIAGLERRRSARRGEDRPEARLPGTAVEPEGGPAPPAADEESAPGEPRGGVTDSSRVEDELREREQRLRLVLEGAETGTWRWEIGADAIEWSDNLGPLHGLPAGSSPSTYEEFLECIHPDDREALGAAVERAVVAGLDYTLEFRTRWPDGTVRWLETRAHVLRDDVGSPTALLGLTQDVTARKQREQAQLLLAEASTLLASTLDHVEMLQALARVAATSLADLCTVHAVGPHGSLDLVAVEHADPDRLRLARELAARYPPEPDNPYGAPNVVRTGRSELYAAIPDAMLVESGRDVGRLALVRSLGLRSAIAAPIALRTRVFGAITLIAAESGRAYDGNDLAAVEELAHRAALAIDNALVHEEEQRTRAEAESAARRALRLQSVVGSLAEAATSEDIARVLVREGAAALEADAVVVYLLEEAESELVLVAQDGYPQWFVVDYGRVSLAATNATAISAREREPRWYSTAEEYHRAHPEFAASFDALGYRALAFLPLETPSGVLGVVGLSFSHPRAFPVEEREHLTALAGQCALAVERALLYEREHRVAVTLQQSLLPRRLPVVDGVSLAVRYLPGSRGLEVGGDWFDAIPLPDGRLAVTVGDVVGRGVQAAATMAQLRYALRAYAHDGLLPGAALVRLDSFTEQLGDRDFATALCLQLEPSSGEVRFANAGHLPPLLLDGRSARLLEGGRSMPLGIEASANRDEDTLTLEPGSTLVLYTDGLVEGRSTPLGDGLTKLLQAAADAPSEPDALLEHLLERLGAFDADRHDDVAVLAVQLEAAAEHQLDLELDASPAALASARARIREWLAELDLGPEEAMEVLVACGEACTNAIEHPRDPAGTTITLRGRVVDDELELRVRDTGGWRVPREHPTRGFGLPFMEQLMHEVDVIPSPSGTEVRLRRRLSSAGSSRLRA
jgi:PAS domain S-box-containing protein